MEDEAQHINTVCKQSSVELLEDEFKTFQAKAQDQVKLDLLKIHDCIKDSVKKAFSEKVNYMENAINKH